MKAEKAHNRRLAKHCNGCNKDIPRPEWDEHVMNIIRGMRV